MSLYVLDTDHVSLFQRGDRSVVERVGALPARQLAVTMITVEEQLRGWLNVIRRSPSGERLVTAYGRLRTTLEYFHSMQLLDFDHTANAEYERLRHRLRVGTQDLRIAATVLAAGGTLVTRNRNDFVQVPDLALEDWSRQLNA